MTGRASGASLGVAVAAHRVWLRSVIDRHDHAVTDAEFEAGLVAARGVYRAVCGESVPPCSMLTPPGPPCATCLERLTEPAPGRHRRHRRRWWSR